MGPTTEYGQKGPAPFPEGQCVGQEVARSPGRGQRTGQRSHRDSVRHWRGGPSDKLPHRDVKADAQRSLVTTEPQSHFLHLCLGGSRGGKQISNKMKENKIYSTDPRCRSHVSSLQCGQYHTGQHRSLHRVPCSYRRTSFSRQKINHIPFTW